MRRKLLDKLLRLDGLPRVQVAGDTRRCPHFLGLMGVLYMQWLDRPGLWQLCYGLFC